MKPFFLACALFSPVAAAQIIDVSTSTTATQAILRYSSPLNEACTLKSADMNRRITITEARQAAGVVSVTTRAAHGLTPGAQIYLEQTGVPGWDGWQTVRSVADPKSFSFDSETAGAATSGNIGVLIDDLNPNLFPGADQDSRPGNPNNEKRRVFVVGKRTAETAADGNRYTRAHQAYSRHHYTLTCGAESRNGEYVTQNPPLGDTHNDGLPVDQSRPGEYAYPTVQWSNRAQSLIDPFTGIRSIRATNPAGTPSPERTFQTAIDAAGAWKSPAGPLGAGTATFTGPCPSGKCALLLRADDFTLYGGATYNTGSGSGSSLDWISVTIKNASVSNGACTGEDCKIAACLTVNGVSCTSAEREVTLTGKPAAYKIGSQSAMDLWQGTGAPQIARPDVSKATGTVNYAGTTRQVSWATGNKFSVRWTSGSRIMVAGSEYEIESIQNEISLTLKAPGPIGNLSGVPYSANNFGVLVWKKSPGADKVTIGQTTYQYGSSPAMAWPAGSVDNCSTKAVIVDGATGYNCFIDLELYWISEDGSDVRDLGLVGLWAWPDGRWTPSWSCGASAVMSQFDPLDGDTWYCVMNTYFGTPGVVKANYRGAHQPYTPGQKLPDCGLNGGVQPCVAFTLMQPRDSDKIATTGPAFNPDYRASGYQVGYHGLWGGISPEGDMLLYTREASGQDSKGWFFIYTLGDRTPAGTGPNSFRPIAAASSYRKAPMSWCSIHSVGLVEGGWAASSHNDLSIKGPSSTYTMALTSPRFTAEAGAPGGLTECPANPFGVTGQTCTDILVAGEPRNTDGAYLQDTQVGDLIAPDGGEIMRIVAKKDSRRLTVQRGYLGTVGAHAGTTLNMVCGSRNRIPVHVTLWNYRADPYGKNIDWTTILPDKNEVGGHSATGHGVRVSSVGTWYRIGEAACPQALLGRGGVCYQVRTGTAPEAVNQIGFGVAVDPPFGGALGMGNPNVVDSHPGPCQEAWCLDSRPMNGGVGDGAATMAGSDANPWIKAGGQVWKLAGGAGALQRKKLSTMAYVGRRALVDVSGPDSALPADAAGAYQYCVAVRAGECRPGSAAGDVYVNAPAVSVPYCYYPGIANQADDTNSICIGPMGAYTGNLVQFGTARQDSRGAGTRRLGGAFSRWNQQGVFWNMTGTPTGTLAFSQVRWLEGVRDEDMITILPPYPPADSTARNTFVPVMVKIPAADKPGARNVVVEFGYAENGTAGDFFCTSRREACVATKRAVDRMTPFYFAKSESYAGALCASGCTVAIPALSQRVLYYRWKQLDAAGETTAISETQTLTTP